MPHRYTLDRFGYYQGASNADLESFCLREGLLIEIRLFQGQHILPGTLAYRSERTLTAQQQASIGGFLDFSVEEMDDFSYAHGFRKITEIGVKALSPGINDPGSALNAIDHLGQLLVILSKKKSVVFLGDTEKQHGIWIPQNDFARLLRNVMTNFRTYACHDIIVVQKLYGLLHQLRRRVINDEQANAVLHEITLLLTDVEREIKNEQDVADLNESGHFWS